MPDEEEKKEKNLYKILFSYADIDEHIGKIQKGLEFLRKLVLTSKRDLINPEQVVLKVKHPADVLKIYAPLLRLVAYTTYLYAKQKRFFKHLDVIGEEATIDLKFLRSYAIKFLMTMRFDIGKIYLADNVVFVKYAHDKLLFEIDNMLELLDTLKMFLSIINIPVEDVIYVVFSDAKDINLKKENIKKIIEMLKVEVEDEELKEVLGEGEDVRIKLVHYSTPEGATLIERYNITRLPAIVKPSGSIVFQGVKGDLTPYIISIIQTTPYSMVIKKNKFVFDQFRDIYTKLLHLFFQKIIPKLVKGEFSENIAIEHIETAYLLVKKLKRVMINLKRIAWLEIPNFSRAYPFFFAPISLAVFYSTEIIKRRKFAFRRNEYLEIVKIISFLISVLASVDAIVKFIEEDNGDIADIGDRVSILYFVQCPKCQELRKKFENKFSFVKFIPANVSIDNIEALQYYFYPFGWEKRLPYQYPAGFWSVRYIVFDDPFISEKEFIRAIFGEYAESSIRSQIRSERKSYITEKIHTAEYKKEIAPPSTLTIPKEPSIKKPLLKEKQAPNLSSLNIKNLDLANLDQNELLRLILQALASKNEPEDPRAFVYKLRKAGYSWGQILIKFYEKFGKTVGESTLKRYFSEYKKMIGETDEEEKQKRKKTR